MSNGDVVSQSNLTENKETLQRDRVPGVISESELQASNIISLSALCDYPAVLQSGTIDATTAKGAVVWEFENAPGKLENASNTTRLAHLSKNFVFWHGTIHYRMVFTKTILQQTKFIVYWLPDGVANPATVDAAVMLQHHVIINPDNAAHVDFAVPYVSTRPYLGVDEATGRVLCRLFQPIVNNVDGAQTTLEYSLFVKSSDVVFRDLKPLPPPSGALSFPDLRWRSTPAFAATDLDIGLVSTFGTPAFYTDSGIQAPSQGGFEITATSDMIINRVVGNRLAREEIPRTYSASTSRTITGTPQPNLLALVSRRVLCCNQISAGKAYGYYAYLSITEAGESWLEQAEFSNNFRVVPCSVSTQLLPDVSVPPALSAYFASPEGKLFRQMLQEKLNDDDVFTHGNTFGCQKVSMETLWHDKLLAEAEAVFPLEDDSSDDELLDVGDDFSEWGGPPGTLGGYIQPEGVPTLIVRRPSVGEPWEINPNDIPTDDDYNFCCCWCGGVNPCGCPDPDSQICPVCDTWRYCLRSHCRYHDLQIDGRTCVCTWPVRAAKLRQAAATGK